MTLLLVRLLERQDLDGGTALSIDLGLAGPVRALCWTVVRDDAVSVDVHSLFDTGDIRAAGAAALAHASSALARPLTTGDWAATAGDVGQAVVGTYPETIETQIEALLSPHPD